MLETFLSGYCPSLILISKPFVKNITGLLLYFFSNKSAYNSACCLPFDTLTHVLFASIIAKGL